ncbi:hypothetical protein Emed_002919 [Eimeria media]
MHALLSPAAAAAAITAATAAALLLLLLLLKRLVAPAAERRHLLVRWGVPKEAARKTKGEGLGHLQLRAAAATATAAAATTATAAPAATAASRAAAASLFLEEAVAAGAPPRRSALFLLNDMQQIFKALKPQNPIDCTYEVSSFPFPKDFAAAARAAESGRLTHQELRLYVVALAKGDTNAASQTTEEKTADSPAAF